MLSAALSGASESWDELAQLPAWVESVIKQEQYIASLAPRFRYMQKCVVLGRGYHNATAFEWALKLKELTYVVAEPYSSADFRHGPIAMLEQGFPVMAVAAKGPVLDSQMRLLESLRRETEVELVVISNDHAALALAQSPIALPPGIPEWLTPPVAIAPGQLFSMYLTQAKGYDPEQPRNIHKVTETH
jgi:glucosamine--fructose-6-phosphate aminotransferase (isomerizing)